MDDKSKTTMIRRKNILGLNKREVTHANKVVNDIYEQYGGNTNAAQWLAIAKDIVSHTLGYAIGKSCLTIDECGILLDNMKESVIKDIENDNNC